MLLATASRVVPRLLIVDDDLPLLSMLRDLFIDAYEVDTAVSAEEALERLGQRSYDGIISDIRMPGLDGRGFHEALAASRPAMLRRLILITGDLSRDVHDFVTRTRVPAVIKPFLMPELRRRVQALLAAADDPPVRAPGPR